MAKDIFRQLQEQLNQYSIGFPATDTGVEIKILQRLYTEEEASIYLNLSLQLEEPETIANRLDTDPTKMSSILNEMSIKGLIFRHRKENSVRYAAAPFVLGVYEYQLKHMDRDLALLIDDFFENNFFETLTDSIPLLRTIPVNQALDSSIEISPFADAREIMASKKTIAVADCICRVQKKQIDQNCDRPMEACFMFGAGADYYVENALARYVSLEEALEILDRCEEAGLINQVASAINPSGMCNCCGDCCAAIIAVKKLPKPAEFVMNNYYAVVEKDLCQSCLSCLDRCQMDAISMDSDDIAEINYDRCIGCGLCVTACPDEAMKLALKPEEDRQMPPATSMELMVETAKSRGTSLTPLSIAL